MPEESASRRRESGRARDLTVRALWLLRENADEEQRRIRLSRQEAAFLGLPEPWYRKAAAKLTGRAPSGGPFDVALRQAQGHEQGRMAQGRREQGRTGGLALGDFASGVDWLLRKQGAGLPIEPGFLGRPAKAAGGFNAQVKALRRALRAVLEERSPAAPAQGAPAARQRARPQARARACDNRALNSFRWALHGMANRNPTMDEVYSYLEDRKCPLYNTPCWRWPGGARPLPDRETWKRYGRKARQAECTRPES